MGANGDEKMAFLISMAVQTDVTGMFPWIGVGRYGHGSRIEPCEPHGSMDNRDSIGSSYDYVFPMPKSRVLPTTRTPSKKPETRNE